MQCEFCSKLVSSIYVLKTHQRSKNCITIQAQNGIEIKPLPFECKYCHKSLTSQQRLDTHFNICKSKPTHATCNLCKEQYRIGQEDEHKTICTYTPVLKFKCDYCHKHFTTQQRINTHLAICKKKPTQTTCILCKENYLIGTEEEHKTKCTYIKTLELHKPKKEYPCIFCHKCFSSQQKLNNHISICKEKKAQELAHVKRDKIQQQQLEQNVKRIEEAMGDQIEQLTFEIRNTKEELEHELRLKDEKIRQLEKLTGHNGITNNIHANTVNQAENVNYNTIFQYITPLVIKEACQDYTIEQIKGGQKEFADVVRKNLINQNGQSGYICTDRSRKKCGYINESHEFVEDVQCNKLIQTSLPALPYIMESYKSSSGDDKYVDDQPQIKKGLDDIMKIDKDSSTFVNQMSKTLPSDPQKDDQDIVHSISETLQEAREDLVAFEEDERQFKMDQEKERKYGYQEPVARTIGGVRLGALDVLYKRYQLDGKFIITNELKEVYGVDETVTQEYDELIKQGRYHGEVVWRI